MKKIIKNLAFLFLFIFPPALIIALLVDIYFRNKKAKKGRKAAKEKIDNIKREQQLWVDNYKKNVEQKYKKEVDEFLKQEIQETIDIECEIIN